MAHRAISLLRSNYGALGLKRTSTRGAISLGSASLASFPTPQGGSRIPELGPYGSVRGREVTRVPTAKAAPGASNRRG